MVAWSYGDDKLWWHGHTEMISCDDMVIRDDKLWWHGHTEMIS